MKNLGMLIMIVFASTMSQAQQGDGTIMGTVYDRDSIKALPFTQVWIDFNGSRIGVNTDALGKYKISAVKSGTYNLHAKHLEEGKQSVNGLVVYSNAISKQNLYLVPASDTLKVFEVVWTEPLIKIDQSKVISLADIKNNPNIQSPKTMLAGMNSDIKLDANDQLIIRGSRAGDVVYFVDGVKQTDMQSVPGVAINSMSVYTGGIPAKYGDTTGGVVILETKSYFDLYYAWKARQD